MVLGAWWMQRPPARQRVRHDARRQAVRSASAGHHRPPSLLDPGLLTQGGRDKGPRLPRRRVGRRMAGRELVQQAMAQVEQLRKHDGVLADAIAQLVTRYEETQSTRKVVSAGGLKTVGLDAELLEIHGALHDLCAQAAEAVRAQDAMTEAVGDEPVLECAVRSAQTTLRDPSTTQSTAYLSGDSGSDLVSLPSQFATPGFPYKVLQDAARVRSRPELDCGSVLGSLHRGDIVNIQEVRRNAGPNGVHRLRFKWSASDWGWVSQTASNGMQLLRPASVAEVQAIHAAKNPAEPSKGAHAGEEDPNQISSSTLPREQLPQQPQLRQELLPRLEPNEQLNPKPPVERHQTDQAHTQHSHQDGLRVICRKQKPRMRTWHERHVRIQGNGLFFYNSDSQSEEPRGSSIHNVSGCVIQQGMETFYFPNRAVWWTLELHRDDLLGDGVTRLAFENERTRDEVAETLMKMVSLEGDTDQPVLQAAPWSRREPEPEPEPAAGHRSPRQQETEPATPRIPYEDLELSDTAIGRGQDKIVYLARYKGNDVAALFAEAGTSLEAEAQIFARAGRHPNLIKFFGLAQHGDTQCLVAERAALGSLDVFLEEHGKSLNLEAKLQMGSQIAAGMAHLHTRSLIHRDLATRNILVCDRGDDDGRGAIVKLTDYGLTKEATRSGAYYGAEKNDLPVLWMAPEALQRRKFTEATDIWAFGVTMWEVLTDGSFPYWQWAEPNDAAIIQRVCSGEVMDVPDRVNAAGKVETCPDRVYKVLLATWRFRPEDRPDFQTVSAMLVALI